MAVWAGGGAFQARAQIVRLAEGLGSLDFRLRGNDGDRHEPDTIRSRPLVAADPDPSGKVGTGLAVGLLRVPARRVSLNGHLRPFGKNR